MHKEYEAALSRKFSKILFDGTERAGLNFGFECGNGWYGLIGGTLLFIDRHAEEHELNVRIRQVKEKFGELRIYCRGGDLEVEIAIAISGLVSSIACERCGCRGVLKELIGWLKVSCDNNCDAIFLDIAEVESYQLSYSVALMAVISYFGSGAIDWLQKENPALNNRPAYELLVDRRGCDEIVVYIGNSNYGV
ncbi:hypothetical protein JQX08_01330 [Pseudomonas sp. UL073]|uniref:Uncharacterized protein n=1 Tax=Zestomonas insulae TaxID=2809017 RepID=A0ABS2IAP0_9GAMM|nr:hypothetical protein [Pseudomonas insulae]MBM7059339.1 hypothetical protein [Pseudomonas insulae]